MMEQEKKKMDKKKSNLETQSDGIQRLRRRKKRNPEQTQDDPTVNTVDEDGGATARNKAKSKRKVPPRKAAAGATTIQQAPTMAMPAPQSQQQPGKSGKNQIMLPATTPPAGTPPQTGPAPSPPPPVQATVVLGKHAVTAEVEAAMDDFVKTTMAKGVAGLRKEFAALKVYTSPNYKFEAFSNQNNGPRNRYKDVVCLDSSRVILNLNVPPESDYIHANNIKLDGLDRSYVATQGPLESTISDFWRLVHQESPNSIVMLCKCVEDGKNKCAQYFPPANSYKNYGCMFVNNKKTENTEDKLFVHSIEALPDGCSNSTTVKLFQMNDWPDRGVPDKPMSILRLLRAIPSGRCIIHCSAGVGRTGTVILIDAIISRLLKGQLCNVKEMFQVLRNQRASAVQAESQYVLIHTCVLNYIRAKMPKYKDSATQFADEVKNAKLV